MIIIEPTAQSSLKSRESSPLSGQEPLLPAYVQQVSHPYSSSRPEYRRSPSRMFLETFFVAVVIIFLISAFTSSVVWSVKDRTHSAQYYQESMPNNDNKRVGPLPSDGPAEACVRGSDWLQNSPSESSQYPQAAHADFYLPASSDALYFLARGSLANGSAKIVDSEEDEDRVKVEVVVSYYTQEALDRVKVCSLQRKPRENGVGIFTPKRWRNRSNKDQLQFDIVVRLPVKHSHLVVKAFETDLPMFSHTVGDIAKTVEFRRFSLTGSNAPITVTSLHAHRAQLTTTNSPITGSYNASRSLDLRTFNAPITVNVGLLNDPARKKPTDLTLVTSNSPIQSSISLTSSKATGGLFNVNATTSNQPLNLKYDASPVDSILCSRVQSSNSPATVTHHGAFEGTVSLMSTILLPAIHKMDVEDPSGQGRHRSLETRATMGTVTGVVYWGARKKVMGYTEIKTTNSPAHLHL